MTHPQQTPPGWYDDGSGRKRWWDGYAWGQFAEDQASAAAPGKSRAGLVIGIITVVVVLLVLGIVAAVVTSGGSGAEKTHEKLSEAFDSCDVDQFEAVTSRNYRRDQLDDDAFVEWCESDAPRVGEPDEVFSDIDDFEDWCQDVYRDDCYADPREFDYYADSLDEFTGDVDDVAVIVARVRDDDGDRDKLAFFYSKVDGDWALELLWQVENPVDNYDDNDGYYDDYYDDDYSYDY